MDKNTIIGFALILAILVGFSWLSRPSEEELAKQQAYNDSIAAVQAQKAMEQEILYQQTIMQQDSAKANQAFDYGVFTNLSQDHIGEFEHSDMEDYVSSKAKLFKQCVDGIFL